MEKSEFAKVKYDGFFPYNLNAGGSVTLLFESEDLAKKFIFGAMDGIKLKAKLELAKEVLKQECYCNDGRSPPVSEPFICPNCECLKKLEE